MIGRRILRRLAWYPNPLCRRSDRIEGWVALLLLIVLLTAGPALGGWAARTSYRADLRSQAWERAHVYKVEAVLAEPTVTRRSEPPPDDPLTARATWTAPDGRRRDGLVEAASNAKAGSKVDLWVDEHGVIRPGPADRWPAGEATLATLAALSGLMFALWMLYRGAQLVLDHQRARAWHREWLDVGPRWSRHRQ